MFLNIDPDLQLKLLRPEDAASLFRLTDRNRAHLKTWLPWLDITKEESDTLSFINTTMKQFADNQGFQMGIWLNSQIVGVVGQAAARLRNGLPS